MEDRRDCDASIDGHVIKRQKILHNTKVEYDDIEKLNFNLYKASSTVNKNIKELIVYLLDGNFNKVYDTFNIQGITKKGQRVNIIIRDHDFGFYTGIPKDEKDITKIVSKINQKIKEHDDTKDARWKKRNRDREPIESMNFVEKINVMNYNLPKKYCYWKVRSYGDIKLVCKYMEDVYQVDDFYNVGNRGNGMDPITSFGVMTPHKEQIKFCSYVKLTDIKLIESSKITCQYNVSVSYNNVYMLKQEGDYFIPPPLKILSFDIETIGTDPNEGQVIQIGCCLKDDKKLQNVIFVLGTCEGVEDTQVFCFKTEEEVLKAFTKFVRLSDPDILSGYNIDGFDLYFILERAKSLSIEDEVSLLGCDGKQCRCHEMMSGSKQQGYKSKKTTQINGRIDLDVFVVIDSIYKTILDCRLTLDSVSRHFLKNDQKDDVHWQEIKPLQEGSDADRAKLAKYCVKDCILPIKLIENRDLLNFYIGQSKLTGTPMNKIIGRGQGFKIGVLFNHYIKKRHLILKWNKGRSLKESVTGATVLDTIKGLWTDIFTMDFASLYPSIMRGENLCISTFLFGVNSNQAQLPYGLKEHQVVRFDGIGVFVKKEVREGFMPQMLAMLYNARKDAKREMNRTTGVIKSNWNALQLALKIVMNSVYGGTIDMNSSWANYIIGAAVTFVGRRMIKELQRYMNEKRFIDVDLIKRVKEMEYWNNISIEVFQKMFKDTKVVYGDTDSVMVYFGLHKTMGDDYSRKRIMNLAHVLADKATKDLFKEPHVLEFEKLFITMLLTDMKKNYAAMMVEKSEDVPTLYLSGIAKKRDKTKLIKNTQKEVIRKLLHKDIKGAIDIVKNVVKKINNNDIEIGDLVVSKTLGRAINDYGSKLPQVEVAKRLNEQGNDIKQGDRLFYVVTEKDMSSTKNEERDKLRKRSKKLSNSEIQQIKQWEKDNKKKPGIADYASDPETVLRNKIKLNVEHYLKGLKDNTYDLLELAEPGCVAKYDIYGDGGTNKDGKGLMKIKDITTGKVKYIEIKRKQAKCKRVKNNKLIGNALKFKVFYTCMNCRTKLKKNVSLCDQCATLKNPNSNSQIHNEASEEMKILKENWSKLVDIEDIKTKLDNTCRDCKIREQLSTNNCRNDQCDIYFKRMEVAIEHEELEKKYNRCSNSIIKYDE